MRVIEKNADVAAVELVKHEITILANAINEVCNGPDAIEEWEFHTRMGATRQEAEALLDALHELV
jgi:hypothetical protein